MKKWLKPLVIGLTVLSLLVVTGCGNAGSGGTQGGNGDSGANVANGASTPAAAKAQDSANVKTRVMKAGIVSPKGHPQGLGLEKFAELVEQKSGGKMKVQRFYDASLGDDKKMMEAVQGGLQEVAGITTPPIFGTIKAFGIFDFPFVINNEKQADAVMDGPIGQKLMDLLPQHKIIGLSYWENGFRSITNSKHPITRVEDFKGIKIRTLPNPIHLEMFKTLGANPTPMVFSEVFSALESKAIDGQENSFAVVESHKLYEVQKYLTITNHLYAPTILIFSKKYWDQLSDEERKIVQEAAAESGKFQRETNRAMAQETLEKLKAAGMQVNEMSPEEKAKMQQLTRPLIDKFSKEIGEDLVKELFKELDSVK
ncbi:TRAP transporter substrate-binding protein [Paenibacillus naphthalenovorans]|uniref:TRAP transporter substrate-binding protein n=1 Tax=Paenibacillus naphthalenovorans TaxID=162209 RepID=UPI00088A594D|nr:TRAP transporter substrate-binding protein [Paenibacillus naphthalenovorans]SDJ16638.1 tripartite ATP-independent transporter solute receptor, DctP family [Paenibacillus naphthalenovorans]